MLAVPFLLASSPACAPSEAQCRSWLDTARSADDVAAAASRVIEAGDGQGLAIVGAWAEGRPDVVFDLDLGLLVQIVPAEGRLRFEELGPCATASPTGDPDADRALREGMPRRWAWVGPEPLLARAIGLERHVIGSSVLFVAVSGDGDENYCLEAVVEDGDLAVTNSRLVDGAQLAHLRATP